jgi:hypothetical protein
MLTPDKKDKELHRAYCMAAACTENVVSGDTVHSHTESRKRFQSSLQADGSIFVEQTRPANRTRATYNALAGSHINLVLTAHSYAATSEADAYNDRVSLVRGCNVPLPAKNNDLTDTQSRSITSGGFKDRTVTCSAPQRPRDFYKSMARSIRASRDLTEKMNIENVEESMSENPANSSLETSPQLPYSHLKPETQMGATSGSLARHRVQALVD